MYTYIDRDTMLHVTVGGGVINVHVHNMHCTCTCVCVTVSHIIMA